MSGENGYRGKVVVITGASSGFGKGTAVELARRGAFLVLASRTADKLAELARECESAGGQALAVPTDVSDRAAVEELARKAISKFGQFDLWLNDAGVAAIGRFDQIPLEDHDQVIRTDLLGTIYRGHCALRHFRERDAGILINVASAIGKIPTPLYASYAAAKFGVVGLSDALRHELGHTRSSRSASVPSCRWPTTPASSSTPATTPGTSRFPFPRLTTPRSRSTRWSGW